MRTERGRYGSRRESGRRAAALVVVIGCHLGLLTLTLRAAVWDRETTPVAENNLQVLQLRFFRQPQASSAHPAFAALQPVAPMRPVYKTPSVRAPKPPGVQSAEHVVVPPSETQPTSAPTPLKPSTGNASAAGDGGFQERLLDAQRSYAVHGVPGSDKAHEPGIHLVDPMNQGIGAAMRTAQRLFGIKNRHCIDVETWRSLTPQELSARHISPADVDRDDEKYDCNAPPGLHF